MDLLLNIILILAAAVTILLIAALFMKKVHCVKREITINVPVNVAFDFLRMLKNQEKFNKWAKDEGDRNWQYKGTDGYTGFTISWNGNKKAGEGSKEITEIIENRKIATQIRFIRPMKTIADVVFETEAINTGSTRVTITNSGILNYPLNIFIPMAEKKFPKDMDESLLKLKTVLEDKGD